MRSNPCVSQHEHVKTSTKEDSMCKQLNPTT